MASFVVIMVLVTIGLQVLVIVEYFITSCSASLASFIAFATSLLLATVGSFDCSGSFTSFEPSFVTSSRFVTRDSVALVQVRVTQENLAITIMEHVIDKVVIGVIMGSVMVQCH